MLSRIQEYHLNYPLKSILWLALFVRLVAIVFSGGYGMHDDHFLVVEAAQSWVDGFDYNNWLPENSITGEPTGHSFFYVGLHYVFFSFCDSIGLTNPMIKMFFVRLFHGLWSMLTVLLAYKITEKLSNSENARIVGILMAVFWFIPILSVRTMVEMVCIPFMLFSFWYLIKSDEFNWKNLAIAGVFMGISIAVRVQTDLIWGGIGLVLLFRKNIIGAAIFGFASVLSLFLTQIADLFLWGYPFAEMAQYVLYNSSNYNDYITQAWFQYIILLIGLLIPPISLFLFFGFFRSWKKYLLLFLPVLIFLVFHSIYPNKQERFILPVIPLFIILGTIGWREFYESSKFWQTRPGLYQGFLKFFWVLNILALIVVTPASSKKSRVDTMYYLSQLDDVQGLLFERSTKYGCYLMPRYYHGDWSARHICYSKNELAKMEDRDMSQFLRENNVNYCLFIEETNLEEREESMRRFFPEMHFVEKIEPSYIDKLLYFLNPVNENEVVYIYRLY